MLSGLSHDAGHPGARQACASTSSAPSKRRDSPAEVADEDLERRLGYIRDAEDYGVRARAAHRDEARAGADAPGGARGELSAPSARTRRDPRSGTPSWHGGGGAPPGARACGRRAPRASRP
jgi:hypothetical protein